MKYTIDRIEGGIAVLECEDGTMTEAPVQSLPQGIREGSALEKTADALIPADNSADRARIENKFAKLLKKG